MNSTASPVVQAQNAGAYERALYIFEICMRTCLTKCAGYECQVSLQQHWQSRLSHSMSCRLAWKVCWRSQIASLLLRAEGVPDLWSHDLTILEPTQPYRLRIRLADCCESCDGMQSGNGDCMLAFEAPARAAFFCILVSSLPALELGPSSTHLYWRPWHHCYMDVVSSLQLPTAMNGPCCQVVKISKQPQLTEPNLVRSSACLAACTTEPVTGMPQATSMPG